MYCIYKDQRIFYVLHISPKYKSLFRHNFKAHIITMAISDALSTKFLIAYSCFTTFLISVFSALALLPTSACAAITFILYASTPRALLIGNIIIPICSLLHLQLEHVLGTVQPITLTTLNRYRAMAMVSVLLYAAWFIINGLWALCQNVELPYAICPTRIPQRWLSIYISVFGWIIWALYIIHTVILSLQAKDEINKQKWATKGLSEDDGDYVGK